METLFGKITEWLKELLVSGTINNLTSLFDAVNERVGGIAGAVGTTPEAFSPDIFNMIRQISETVIMPIAGIILTFIACYELITLVTDRNNLANLDTWIFFKWVFKTAIAVLIITNTFNIVMAVFDVGQHVISQSADIITAETAVDASTIADFKETLEKMDVGPLFGMFLETFLLHATLEILSVIIFVIVYARMIEIYLMTSLAPIPMATFGSKEKSIIGQNYFRSLFALAFQGFLIMICVGIYAMLIQSSSFISQPLGYVWSIVGFTVLLAFTLFRTGSIAKSVFDAH